MNTNTRRVRLTLPVKHVLHENKAVDKKNQSFSNESSWVSGASSKTKKGHCEISVTCQSIQNQGSSTGGC